MLRTRTKTPRSWLPAQNSGKVDDYQLGMTTYSDWRQRIFIAQSKPPEMKDKVRAEKI
jgi:hypothetical protein